MNLRLDQFEQQIDETILKRGYGYFQKGRVTEVDDLGGGDYEATVEGSDTYTVRLHVEGNEVTDYECDCPYDLGPVCKHVAAVLFHLQKDLAISLDDLAERKQSKPKKESETHQLEWLLEKLPHDRLKAFVREICTEDRRLKKRFIARNIALLYPDSKEVYARQIEKLASAYADHGFIDYYASNELGREVYNLAEKALIDLYNGNKRTALYKAEAIVEGMAEAIGHADDSNGEIGGSISHAFHVLNALGDKDLDADLHDEMFDWLLACWEKGILRGWDWHFDLMTVAIELAKTERETQRIREALSQMELEEEDSWERQQAQEYMLTLICKTEGEDAGVRFMEERLSNSGFREKLIERAIRQGDFAKAERLAEEGVKQDEKNLPGLADDWRNYLLEIYQRVSNKEQVVRLARYFLMSFSERYHAHRYYYDLLKSLVPSEQWTGYVEGVVAELNEDNRYGRRYAQIAELYVWEEQWVKLLKLLWRYPAFSHIEEAEKYLKADYAEELASLYRDTILTYLENNMGREHYQMACKYIRRMIKLKAQPMAMELVETLKTTYRKRRALLEELERI